MEGTAGSLETTSKAPRGCGIRHRLAVRFFRKIQKRILRYFWRNPKTNHEFKVSMLWFNFVLGLKFILTGSFYFKLVLFFINCLKKDFSVLGGVV